tara:strand:- start:299 stop:1144 length:846 start_codon:yes stop_codon:yes gene_type:complete
MERIKANEVQSMMEAYASIYNNQEQEVISEEVAETEVLEEDPIKYLGDKFKKGADQIGGFFNRFSPGPGINPNRAFSGRGSGRAAFRDSNIPANSGIKQSGGGLNKGEKPQPKPQPRPQSPSSNLKPGNPNVVVSPKSGEETKFERRLPTMAELRAAQAARKAAAAAGASKKEAEYQAVKAGVGVSKGTVKDPKIAADAKRKAELEAIRAKAKADTMKKSRLGEETELDIFDTIKEYLIGEGATEEEALQQMLTLTDEQRTEIIEGSYGSMKKKKKGGYRK